jgi:hypothetical protein
MEECTSAFLRGDMSQEVLLQAGTYRHGAATLTR